MAKPKKKSLSREEILEKKRQYARKRYESIKNDPVRYAAYKEKDKAKYLKERVTGVRKTISEMTDREKRHRRKIWRADSAKSYQKKKAAKKSAEEFIRANTPSSLCENDEAIRREPRSETPQILSVNPSPRECAARKRSIRQRRLRNDEIKSKNTQIMKLKHKLSRYRKKVYRLQKEKQKLKKQLTPNSKMTQMADNPETRSEVVKKALFGDIIEEQITKNLTKLNKKHEKVIANKLLLGSIVKERKIWKTNKKVVTYKKIWNAEKQKQKNANTKRCLKKLIEEFLEDDKYSRLGAGKKEYIKKNKIRKQKRYRLDTLRNLHKEFLKNNTTVVSYSMFARLSPFWIVVPKVADRETCMCTLHSNFQLVVTALNKAKVLDVSTYQNLLISLCCDRYSVRCLERICDNCCSKTVPLCTGFNESMSITYQKWEATRETITDTRTKKDRIIVKNKKIKSQITAGCLVQKLNNDLKKIFNHERNIVHQYQTMKTLKDSLTEKDAVVHMDFSENFATKYSEEIQSVHFGGSRAQLSLHTVVVYLQKSTRSYCTVSSDLSHNVPAIWAHLQSVLEELPATVENIHFLSDGPVTQYRNKLMFYILACKMGEMWPNFINWTWNYHEAGHGKGAPDGVGATCKRSADLVVACGADISNLTEFCGAVQDRCPNVTLFTVTSKEIEKMDKLISKEQPTLVPFNGTLKVHQVQGNSYLSQRVVMKSLSCFCSATCEHFRMGVVEYPKTPMANVDDIFGESDSEKNYATSPSTIYPPAMPMTDETLSIASDLTLKNIDFPDDLLSMADLDIIDPKDLFSERDETPQKKKKLSENVKKVTEHKTEGMKVKAKKESQKKKLKSNTKKKGKKERIHDCQSDDCSCIICGDLYKEDTTGQDWIQCIICHQWAQIACIKTDPNSFTCPECLLDADYCTEI